MTHLRLTRRALGLGLLALPAAAAFANEAPATTYDRLLARHVAAPDGQGLARVRYAAWAKSGEDRAALAAVIAGLAAAKPSAMPKSEAFAFWANLYNAVTLDTVLERYPVASIRQIRSQGVGIDPRGLIGPWRTKRVTVEGRRLSLDEIENAIMRPTFKDPRVHYSINCASVGCPNLKASAWRAPTLDADLDAAARAFINTDRGMAVKGGKITLSSIYKWFAVDFGDEAGLRAHLAKYAEGERAAALAAGARIAGYAYNWDLNDVAFAGG